MKKFITITAITTFTSLCCAILSFCLLDIQKFIKHINTSENINIEFGFRDPIFGYSILDFIMIPDSYHKEKNWEEKLEIFSEKIEETTEHFTDSIEENAESFAEHIEEKAENIAEYIEDGSYYFSDNIENHIEHIIENYLNNNITDIIDLGLRFSNARDGYIDKNFILKNTKYYNISDEIKQNTQDIKLLELNLKNTDMILAKSKTEKIEMFLLEKKSVQPSKLNPEHNKDTGTLELKHKASRKSHALIYLLIPESFNAMIKANTANGDLVAINQTNKLNIISENSDIIISQKESRDLTIQSDNGDIIVSLGKHPDAKIHAHTKEGSIIGLGSIKDNNSNNIIKKNLRNGTYKINLSTKQGSIIIN